jgi:Ca2+-binding EF-hand superfamily protein
MHTKLFNSLGINGDGAISAHEAKRMIEAGGYSVGHKEVEQVINKMEKWGLGRVYFNEFAAEGLRHKKSSEK